jgi:hypothetical protein
LTLAVNLGLRGGRCTLVEQKEAPQFPHRYVGSLLIVTEASEGPEHNFIDDVPSTIRACGCPTSGLKTERQCSTASARGAAIRCCVAGNRDAASLGRTLPACGAPYAVLRGHAPHLEFAPRARKCRSLPTGGER